MKDDPATQDALNVCLQVLKFVSLSLAIAQRADLVKCATLMQTHATLPTMDPRARAMLLDIADGFDMLGRAIHHAPPTQ